MKALFEPGKRTLADRVLVILRRGEERGSTFDVLRDELATRANVHAIRTVVKNLAAEGWIAKGHRVEHGYAWIAVEHVTDVKSLTTAQRARREALTKRGSEAA